jgi:hypothetical protein
MSDKHAPWNDSGDTDPMDSFKEEYPDIRSVLLYLKLPISDIYDLPKPLTYLKLVDSYESIILSKYCN